jgi:D-alanine-D-alanine ligase
MILSDDGLYFLETNTLPGLTQQSFVPQQLQAQGISMHDFLWAQIERAARRKI